MLYYSQVYLGGPRGNKDSHSMKMGEQNRHAEKTLIDAQQVTLGGSQRDSVLATDAHENCEAVDTLILASMEPGTATNTDGGHSNISAFNHCEDLLGAPRQTVNHSKHM